MSEFSDWFWSPWRLDDVSLDKQNGEVGEGRPSENITYYNVRFLDHQRVRPGGLVDAHVQSPQFFQTGYEQSSLPWGVRSF
jgi:hypothetical protein